MNGFGPKTKVRNRHRTRLLRIVDEISLGVVAGILPDNLDGILVGAHRSIGAEAVKHSAHDAVRLDRKLRIVAQAAVTDVVVDANREMIFLDAGAKLSKTAFTMAGVNSLEDSP